MKIEKIYKYLGTNGVICSPVFLENIYCIKLLQLMADEGKILYNKEENIKKNSILIPENELDNWKEVEDNSN